MLSWGDDVVAQKRIPFRAHLLAGEHFALPGDLASYALSFPSGALPGHAALAGDGALLVSAHVTEREARPARARLEGAFALAVIAAALVHAVAALLGAATPGDDEATVAAERRATADAYVQNAHDSDGTPGTAGAISAQAFTVAPTPATPGTPTMADEPDEAHNVATFGMLGLLDTLGTTPSPGFAVHGPSEASDLFGDGSWSRELGGSGMGLSGVGEGGGGTGRGVDLAGPLGGAVVTTGQGQAHLMGRHVITWRCTLGMSTPTVVGHLEASAIQRVVRANEGRFRACYVEGLARTPTLEGRVAVKFLIGRDGTVVTAEDTAVSDLPDADVRACVVRAFTALSFPEPGGVVSVTYPFVLSPGD